MNKIVFLLICLVTMSCSAYNHQGLPGKKKPQAKSKIYYRKNLKSNKSLHRKYKNGTKSILAKEKKSWEYSRAKSTTHREILKNSEGGGYGD